MSLTIHALETHLNQLLGADRIKDYAPNGLQVQGRDSVQHIVTGVTACQALLDEACARGADTVLVHHGYFWKGEDPCVTGIKRNRLSTLLGHDMNLLAYHLPLDMHPTLGNNVLLGHELGLNIRCELADFDANALGFVGTLETPMKASELSAHIERVLGRKPGLIGRTDKTISTMAWCTGAAQSFLQAALNAKVDAYLTGEINEPAVHLARETDTVYFEAGHHATERCGVKALGEHIKDHFGVHVEFVDIDNPV